jgi:hypothetical protein
MTPSRRRARFAALAVLCLSLPAAARAQRAVETVSSPFGTFQGGWAGALGGAMLKPSGALNLYAFPSPLYNETAASAPDAIVLRRLAPVVVALERNRVTPDDFMKLSAGDQTKKIKALLPESYQLVAGYADKLRERADAVKNGEESGPLFGEMLGFLLDYPNYMDESTRTNLRSSFQTLRMKRVMVEAQAAAKNLNGRAAPEDADETAAEFAGRPAPSLFADPRGAAARLFEIKVLSDQITAKASQGGSTPARLAAAARAYRLATTGEPNEAVQKAAVRLLTTAIEIDSRRLDGVLYAIPTIDQLGALAKASPFAGVQKSSLNNLTDNAISLRKPYGRSLYRSAVAMAGEIAAATSSREVKAEAIALLLREFRSSTGDRLAAAAALRGIAVMPDVAIAKVPAKSASRERAAQNVSAGILVAGALAFIYGLFSGHLAAVGVGILIVLLGHGIRFAFKHSLPWYRRNS